MKTQQLKKQDKIFNQKSRRNDLVDKKYKNLYKCTKRVIKE